MIPPRRDIAVVPSGHLVTVEVLAPEPGLVACVFEERGQGMVVEAALPEVLRASVRLEVIVVYEARVVRVLALSIEAREGQQSEVVSRALEKLAPSVTHAESSGVREKTDLSRSSARIRITLGLPCGWGVPTSVSSRPRSHEVSRIDVQIKTNTAIHR